MYLYNCVNRTFEIRSPEEMDEGVAPPAAEDGLASSAAASITHAKPSRPGRANARKVTKFVADPENESL